MTLDEDGQPWVYYLIKADPTDRFFAFRGNAHTDDRGVAHVDFSTFAIYTGLTEECKYVGDYHGEKNGDWEYTVLPEFENDDLFALQLMTAHQQLEERLNGKTEND